MNWKIISFESMIFYENHLGWLRHFRHLLNFLYCRFLQNESFLWKILANFHWKWLELKKFLTFFSVLNNSVAFLIFSFSRFIFLFLRTSITSPFTTLSNSSLRSISMSIKLFKSRQLCGCLVPINRFIVLFNDSAKLFVRFLNPKTLMFACSHCSLQYWANLAKLFDFLNRLAM